MKDLAPIGEDPRSLAQAWWALHSNEGVRAKGTQGDYRLLDWANEVDSRVDEIGRTRILLEELLFWLVREAPEGEDLGFVGTWVLEDAAQWSGKDVVEVLRSSRLTRDEINAVLSGFRE